MDIFCKRLLVIALIFLGHSAKAAMVVKLNLVNDMSVPLEFGLGSRTNPPLPAYRGGKLKLTTMQPNTRQSAMTDSSEPCRIMIRATDEPDKAVVYEFSTGSETAISLRIKKGTGNNIEIKEPKGISIKKIATVKLSDLRKSVDERMRPAGSKPTAPRP